MSAIERIRHRGLRNAERLNRQLAAELRDARLAADVSQGHVARVAGLSRSAIGRAERAATVPATLGDLSAHCAALGLRLSLKVYPDGTPVRDSGQLNLIARLLPQLHDAFRIRREVPIEPGENPRAWDVRLDGPGTIGIDAETRLHDIQALQRRSEAKWRDSGLERMVLLVARTRHNTLVLRDHREALRSTYPADTGEIMGALRAGRSPRRNGLVLL